MRPCCRSIPWTVALFALSLPLVLPAGAAAGDPSPADWQKDLRVLIDELEAVHPDPWFHTSRARVTAAADELSAQLPGMTRNESLAGYFRTIAMLRDGHTRINGHDNPQLGLKRVQLLYQLFPDGLHVITAHPDHAEVLGGRVVRIGNMNAEEAYARMEELVPADNEWTLRDRTPRYLTFADLLDGIGAIHGTDGCPIEVETEDGRRVSAVIPCDTAHEESGWPTALEAAGTAPPLYLQQPERNYFFEYLSAYDAVYLCFRQVRNEEDESFADFCTRAFAFLDEKEVDRLIVDLRLNGGGNNFLNQPLIHGIIRNDRVNREGHLFVVTGRRTFSAAMCGTIDLERQTKALFVGEPTGATPNHHGDAVPIELPHTGVVVSISGLYWQNSDPRDRRPWLEPDLPAELTWKDYIAGRDPALEAVLSYEEGEREQVYKVVDGWLAEGASVAEAIARYRELRESADRTRYDLGHYQLNAVGYRLLQQGQTENALAMFRLNTEVFPWEWNPWDSLGEALATAGRTEEAIRAYAKSVELNPTNRGGQAALRKLRREATGTQ